MIRKKVSEKITLTPAPEVKFSEIINLIIAAQKRAYQVVNTVLIDLYWQVGGYINHKLENAEWGDNVVDELAYYLAKSHSNLSGFTRVNLFRMQRFYKTYCHTPKLEALLRQLSWTHNLIILTQSKHPEEREFYLRMAAHAKWSSRELERQFKAALFERSVLNPPKFSTALIDKHPEALSVFKDAYMVEFLGLSNNHAEHDLHKGLSKPAQNLGIHAGDVSGSAQRIFF